MRLDILAGSAMLTALLLPAGAGAQSLTMSDYWPNDDGRSWIYDQEYREYSDEPEAIDNQVRLFFEGTTTAPVGIAAQVLRAEVVGGPAGPALALGAPAAVRAPLLRNLWIARPDLHAAILGHAQEHPCPTETPPGVYGLLIGGDWAYRKTADEIAAWRCNADDLRAWLWLVSDLRIGTTFSLQLIPDMADNVFLRGTVAAVEAVSVPAGSYPACLRVDYRIDYGVSVCTGPGGDVTGSFRSETRGSVHYAPGVGPVQSFEELIPYAEADGTCVDPELIGDAEISVAMRLRTEPFVRARSSTWGAIKTAYLD